MRWVKALGHPADPGGGQAFSLLLYKMRADRQVGKKQAVKFLFDTILFAVCCFPGEISHGESAHLPDSYNVCYMFVYSLNTLNEEDKKYGSASP